MRAAHIRCCQWRLADVEVDRPADSLGRQSVWRCELQQYKDLASLLPKLKESRSTEVLATGEFYKSVKFADDETMLGRPQFCLPAAHLLLSKQRPLPAAEIRYCGRRSAATCKAHPSTTSSRKRVKSSTWSTVSWYSATTVAWIQPTFRWLPP